MTIESLKESETESLEAEWLFYCCCFLFAGKRGDEDAANERPWGAAADARHSARFVGARRHFYARRLAQNGGTQRKIRRSLR